jgi:hypothetical protein
MPSSWRANATAARQSDCWRRTEIQPRGCPSLSARLADAGETAGLAGRHLEWAAGLAQRLGAGTAAADPSALTQLEAEVANFHAALDHAATAAPASHAGLRLVAALGFFWVHRGYALAGDDRASATGRRRPHPLLARGRHPAIRNG